MSDTKSDARRVDALQLIFSVFLGALLVVVVGVGVWTFYPQPFDQNSPEQKEIDKLYREQEQATGKTGIQTPAQKAEFERIQKDIDARQAAMQKARDAWAVTTSIVLLVFATILMAISLFLPDHMRVFSNGILLGGLFTVIYGTGWSFAGGDSRARFFVVLVALLLAIAFGYLRFIRGRQEKAADGRGGCRERRRRCGGWRRADRRGLGPGRGTSHARRRARSASGCRGCSARRRRGVDRGLADAGRSMVGARAAARGRRDVDGAHRVPGRDHRGARSGGEPVRHTRGGARAAGGAARPPTTTRSPKPVARG